MGKIIAGITISLDGYINDKDGSVEKLYADFNELKDNTFFQATIENTGAVIMGRHVYEMQDPFEWANETYEFQVPIFVLTHNPPDKYPQGNDKLSFTFVTDGVESAVKQAKQAAENKDVQIIGGADTIQQSLNAGVCDELQLDMMPVLFGKGIRLFENVVVNKVKLEKAKVEELTSKRTSFTYKIIR